MAVVAASDDPLLQAYTPKGIGKDPPSLTIKQITLTVYGTDESITIPVYTNTKVLEVKTMLANKVGVEPQNMKFIHKQSVRIVRENHDTEECARVITIKGIASFKRAKHKYDKPHAIIGAGHIGLKVAMTWLMESPPFTDFVVFDRRPEVGGTSWWQQANATSRLQTEVGVYHLEYHPDNGWPPDCQTNPWPSRNQLLSRFKQTASEFGILPYCKMNTNVTLMNIIGKEPSQHYELTLDAQGKEKTFECASVMLFPGNLTNPKRVIYKGEELFDGDIVYGISSEFDYATVRGHNVTIIGSGAFAVENVRTCVEHAAAKVFMVCRRKNMPMPRVVSWYCNQSINPMPAAWCLELMQPMYDLIGDDQWSFYSVFASADRKKVNIKQKSRFGIGDTYFLSMYYGHCEHIVDDVKRVSEHRIHLVSGRVLDDVFAMLKLLGFNGEFDNDRLLRIKEMHGWWPNKDPKRYIVSEPIGVDANNFSTTSFSPGATSWAEHQIYLLHYPKDWDLLCSSGLLPTHVADVSIDRPAYVVEARYGTMTGIITGSCVPGLAEVEAKYGLLKHQRMWQMHPIDTYLLAAKKEWDAWGKTLQSLGYDKEHPEYPYTEAHVREFVAKEWALFPGQ